MHSESLTHQSTSLGLLPGLLLAWADVDSGENRSKGKERGSALVI